jgi:hypothetical protein
MKGLPVPSKYRLVFPDGTNSVASSTQLDVMYGKGPQRVVEGTLMLRDWLPSWSLVHVKNGAPDLSVPVLQVALCKHSSLAISFESLE